MSSQKPSKLEKAAKLLRESDRFAPSIISEIHLLSNTE